MKPILIAGTVIVTFALIFYTIAIFNEQKKVQVTNVVLIFLTIGISLDITATTCMIIGSENPPFTLHGILGYSSLTAMLLDTILIWKLRLANGLNVRVSKKFTFIFKICLFLVGFSFYNRRYVSCG